MNQNHLGWPCVAEPVLISGSHQSQTLPAGLVVIETLCHVVAEPELSSHVSNLVFVCAQKRPVPGKRRARRKRNPQYIVGHEPGKKSMVRLLASSISLSLIQLRTRLDQPTRASLRFGSPRPFRAATGMLNYTTTRSASHVPPCTTRCDPLGAVPDGLIPRSLYRPDPGNEDAFLSAARSVSPT